MIHLRSFLKTPRAPAKILLLSSYCFLLLLYLFVVWSVLVIGRDGTLQGVLKGWGDTAYHLDIIGVLAESESFRPEQPAAAGERLTYPFAVDFFSAMLRRAGASMFAAFQIPAILSAVLLFWAFWRLARQNFAPQNLGEFGREWLALAFVALVLFGGGFGFLQFFRDVAAGAPFSHEYTHLDDRTGGKPPEMDAPHNIVWVVPAISFFSHQRAFILGAALGALILWGISRGRWKWLIAAGSLPLVHTHTFLAFAMILPVFFIAEVRSVFRSMTSARSGPDCSAIEDPRLRRDGDPGLVLGVAAPADAGVQARGASESPLKALRAPIGFALLALLIALPQVWYLLAGKSGGTFLQWWPGWMARGYENVLWFWTKNFGVVFWGWVIVLGASLVPIAIGTPSSLGLRSFLKTPRAPASDAPPQVLQDAAPAASSLMAASLLLFAAGNLVKFQPWEFDNNKIFFWWWLLATLIVLSAIGKVIETRPKPGIALLFCFVFFGTFAGFLDVAGRVKSFCERSYGYYGAAEIEAAEWIRANTAPGEAFLTAGYANDFVPMLAGRPLYLGFIGWLWTQGGDALILERRAAISEFLLSGKPQRLCSDGVKYVVWDRQFEFSHPDADRGVIEATAVPVFERPERTIYRLSCPGI